MIDKLINKVQKQMATEEGRQEFYETLVEYSYKGLNRRDKEIYEEALTIFDVKTCNTDVLPILVMGYLDYGINTKEAILKDQATLVEPFRETEAMYWTIDKLLEQQNKCRGLRVYEN